MKKIIALSLLLLPLYTFAENVKVVIFTSPTCGHCHNMREEFLPAFQAEFKDRAELIEIDTSTPEGSIIFKETADAYGHGYYVPAVAVGETYLVGYPNAIGNTCRVALETALANNEVTKVNIKEVKSEEVFNQMTLSTIILAGLGDGINPCAFAVVVFFISFLSVYGYKNKEVIYVGLAYCAAVFVAYFLMGFGLFKFIHAMSGFTYVIKVFYWLTGGVCLLFFFLSIYDFIIYKRTGKADDMLLQLPKNLKLKINKIIGFFMRGKEGQKSPLRIIGAAFAAGFLVSIIEAVCTGQVYIPTIVLIMKDPYFRVRAVMYLLLYNLMFIMPLLAVFFVSVMGYKSEGVSGWFKKHLGLAKLALAFLFLALFIMIFIS